MDGTGGAIGAATSLAQIGAGLYQGRQAEKAQRRSLERQEQAQSAATARAAGERRRQRMEQRELRKRRPDTQGLLERERSRRRGAASTVLTGAGGVAPGTLTLAGPSPLGG